MGAVCESERINEVDGERARKIESMELISAKLFSRRTICSVFEEILSNSGMDSLYLILKFSICVSFLESESYENIHVNGILLIPKGFL